MDKNKNRKWIWYVIPAVVIVLLILGYSNRWMWAKETINVATEKRMTGERRNYIVYDNGVARESEPFSFDKVTKYKVLRDDYECDIINNKVVNIIKKMEIEDENGTISEAPSEICSIIKCVANEINHDIFDFEVIVDGTNYYVFVRLNVNWQEPCILYKYVPENGKLKKLCQWDGVDILGIREIND